LFCGKAALECGDAVSALKAPRERGVALNEGSRPTGSDALQGATRNPLHHFILAAEGLFFRAQPRKKPRPFPLNFSPFEPVILHYSLWELCFAAFHNEQCLSQHQPNEELRMQNEEWWNSGGVGLELVRKCSSFSSHLHPSFLLF
jgi:hypothetical protein